uniref:Uncharacterized 32.5 kDa protein in rpl14-rpl12 intergenic region n=1 Tax=Euglena longa TaxID=3037 RepID=YCY3_EUGLO|nr:hypothetical protein AsloCp32 [Euglena longa]P58147.1 RecName: Full=Uncharacterized 32.5 kDa protein in rpl14-rpl12 intergenic region; AltName: Full=ORF263 [Euglena longa]CAC24603.1 hypothetical protein [Euglena longa]
MYKTKIFYKSGLFLHGRRYIYRKPKETNYWKNYIIVPLYINDKEVGIDKTISEPEYILLDIILYGPLKIKLSEYFNLNNKIIDRTTTYKKLLEKNTIYGINFNFTFPILLNFKDSENKYQLKEYLDFNNILQIYLIENKKYIYRELRSKFDWDEYNVLKIRLYVNHKSVIFIKDKYLEEPTELEYIVLDLFLLGPLEKEYSENYKIIYLINERNKRYKDMYDMGEIYGINIRFDKLDYFKFLNSEYSTEERIYEKILFIYIIT